MSRLTIHLLGTPRLEFEGQPLAFDTRKAIALLAYLAVTGEAQARDTLAAFLWPEYDQSRSRAALRRTLSTLKAAVDGYGLAIERETLSLDQSADLWIDVRHFRQLLKSCQTHGHDPDAVCPLCQPLLSEAVELYRDDFMAGFSLRDSIPFDDWQSMQSERLRRELGMALRGLVQCHQAQGQFNQAIDHTRRLLELDPLQEPAHRQLMILYASAGQRPAALNQYRECVRILELELGVPPLEETTTLYEQILAGEIDAEVIAPPAGLAIFPPPRPAPSPIPLVGRETDWATLLDSYGAVDAGGRFAVLEGEAGIGKTRLAQLFLESVRQEGATTITAQCYEGETGLAYAPFAEGLTAAVRSAGDGGWLTRLPAHWLAEAARLVPDLAPLRPAGAIAEGPGAQSRFYEAICQLLIALCGTSPPGVLFLDDVHWADAASLDLLGYLVRRLRNRPLFVLVSWRGKEFPPEQRLMQMLAATQRAGTGKLISLNRLDEAAVRELVQAAAGNTVLAHRLYRETEGLPFFLVEYLAMLESDLADDVQAPDSKTDLRLPMPGSVRGLLRSRLAPVSETGRQLLHTAAVIGRSFDFDILHEVSGRGEEETISALEELLARGLVIEQTATGGPVTSPAAAMGPVYDFSHENLRALVYDETSLARRRLLHRRVAQALLSRQRLPAAAGRASITAAQPAYHFQQAGLEEVAAQYYKQAGDEARALYANAEALAHYQSALALGHADTAALREAIGDLHTLRGEYGDALANYEMAAALLGSPAEPDHLARLETKLGGVYHRHGDWALAAGYFQQALNRLGDDGQRARLLTDWSLTAHHSGDRDQALNLAEEALSLAEAAQDSQALAQAHNILGILANSRGDGLAASQHLGRSFELADTLDDPGVKIAALNNLSLARRSAGDIDQAMALAEQALALCVELGDRHHEAALQNNLADLLHAAGQPEEAMVHLKRAVAIYADIGGEPGQWLPEIWKLTEW